MKEKLIAIITKYTKKFAHLLRRVIKKNVTRFVAKPEGYAVLENADEDVIKKRISDVSIFITSSHKIAISTARVISTIILTLNTGVGIALLNIKNENMYVFANYLLASSFLTLITFAFAFFSSAMLLYGTISDLVKADYDIRNTLFYYKEKITLFFAFMAASII